MPLPIGSKQYLGSFDATIHAFGTISDLDTPDLVEYSIEGFGRTRCWTPPRSRATPATRETTPPSASACSRS
jgi:hypothetical protein